MEKIVGSEVVDTNGQGHGALAGFLSEGNVDVLICGVVSAEAQEMHWQKLGLSCSQERRVMRMLR